MICAQQITGSRAIILLSLGVMGTKKVSVFKASRPRRTPFYLFPLDRSGGLGGEVPEDAVDALDLVRDAPDDVGHELKVQLRNLGGDGVHGVDGADHDGPLVGAQAVGNAGGLKVGHDGEVLPDLALKTVFLKLLAQNRVGLAHSLEPVAGDGTDAAHAETGAREGLAVDHAVREAQGLADHADLVLIQELDGLHKLKVELRGQAAHVVVRLDGAGLQDIGIDGALGEEADAVELFGFLGKDVDKHLADDLALLLGIGDAGKLVEEAVHRVDVDEVRVHLVAEDLDHLLGLALAEKAVIDMDADELPAHSPDEKRRDDGGIHAAGEGQQDLLVADLGAQGRNLLVNKSLGEGRGGDARHAFGTSCLFHSTDTFLF